MSCKKENKTPEADESILKIDLSMREDVSPEEMEERLEEDLDETLGELEVRRDALVAEIAEMEESIR